MMKGVKLTLNIERNVHVKLNALLAQIVITNLINNSNRHNTSNGEIFIELSHENFYIENTGLEQEFSNDTIFQRFKKGKHKSESIGIGLALVKKILTVYDFDIMYNFHQKRHSFTIKFNKFV